MTIPYQVAIGATLVLYIEALDGDPTTVSGMSAQIKSITSPTAPVPPESAPSVGQMIVTLQTTAPGYDPNGNPIMPGWNLTLPATLSATLATGFYIVDMAYNLGGAEFVTTPVIINVVNAVSL